MSEMKQISCTEIDCFRKLVQMLHGIGFSAGDETPETLTEIIASMMFDNVDALRGVLKEQHERRLQAEVAQSELEYFQEIGRVRNRPLSTPTIVMTHTITPKPFQTFDMQTLTPEVLAKAQERLQELVDTMPASGRAALGLYDAWNVLGRPSDKHNPIGLDT